MTAGDEFKREYLCDDISVSYTLKTDDITKGEKPPMSPYASRKESFSGGFAPLTKTRLTIKRDGSAKEKIDDFVSGKTASVPELEREVLPVSPAADGRTIAYSDVFGGLLQ